MSSEAESFLGLSDDSDLTDATHRERSRPICNILALAVPVVYIIGAIICLNVQDSSGWEGYGLGLGLLGLLVLVIVPISFILSILSLWRRERWLPLTIFEFVIYFIVVCLIVGFLI